MFHVKHCLTIRGQPQMSEFITELTKLCNAYGYVLPKSMYTSMNVYYEELACANRQFNITRIIAPEAAALRHFFDSIVPMGELPQKALVVDVGSGGGFPIVPLKIARPDIRVAAMEASKKKCEFIEEASKNAGIEIETINERAEDAARAAYRETFDVCVSRAVAPLRILLELCTPLVKKGGLFFAYKTSEQSELEEAQNACKQLAVKLVKTVKTPVCGYDACVYIFEKTEKTNEKFPRNFSQIKKNPL